jgi:hypothetical protein
MALTSPGLEVQVIDESTYLPSAQATVPLILLATASNKLFNGTVTTGTLKANAGKLDAVSSQRELITKYGTPRFQTSSIGTQLHGDERNEYGLMAAYSALGLGNRAYIIRADIDLDDLEPTASRPNGEPADGTYWLDTAQTEWGIYEWSTATGTFSKKTPILISDSDLTAGLPKVSVGVVGSYAIVLSTATTLIKMYYKGLDYSSGTATASWVEVGSAAWQAIVPTVTGSVSNPTLTAGNEIVVNGTTITLAGTTIQSLASQVNAANIPGVTARAIDGKLTFFSTSASRSNANNQNGIISDGTLVLANGTGTPLTSLGITPRTYYAPLLQSSTFAGIPEWSSFDDRPRPTGSIWFKTSTTGDGLNVVLNQYNEDENTWVPVATPMYKNEPEALFGLDPVNGGSSIDVGTIFGVYDTNNDKTANLQLYRRRTTGTVSLTSNTLADNPFIAGNQFTINVSYNSSTNVVSYTVKLTGTSITSFVSDVIALNIPNLTCTLADNKITIAHTKEGMVNLTNVIGTPITTAGFSSDTSDYAIPLAAGVVQNAFSIAGTEMLNTGVLSTSSSALALDTSSNKTIVIQAGLGATIFSPGQYVHVYSTTTSTNFLKGVVASYNNATGQLEIVPTEVSGSGTGITNWTVTTRATNYTIGEFPPAVAVSGDRWLDIESGLEYIYSVSTSPGEGSGPWVQTTTNDNFFTSIPGAPEEGDKWHNSTNKRLYTYSGAKWNEVWSAGDRTIGVTLTGFEPLVYTFSASAPVADPADGAIWYYSSAADVDIMINTSTGWKGYRNGGTDARGYNLGLTDAMGVIASASQPTYQSDGVTPVRAGDLWLDTSDLINYPKIYRYNGSTWDIIDKSDQITANGILFADARWGTSGSVDASIGGLPAIGGANGLVNSNYLDLDAPDYRLYPRGMLLFNTRRSGFNVKRFKKNYFNTVSFPNVGANSLGLPTSLPTEKDCWVTASGLKLDGSMYAGPQAQRNMVVSALRAAVDSNVSVREDQYEFNIIACPGYPELISNMVGLNNDRVNTAFVVGDTPMKLAPNIIDIVNWSNNSNGDGLSTPSEYLGVFYPAGLASDLEGDEVVVPASHMILRTIMRSDNISYPWFAPAGARRGIVDNATSIGYINSATNEFVRFGVGKSIRDTLYENKINPLTILPGTGLLNYGQKTRYGLTSALDRINVSRLIAYMRKALQPLANNFLFEPNDSTTRDQIKNAVEGLCNDLVAKRALYDYIVVCDDSNNTPDRIARNELYVDIAIAPVRAVEFIYIPLRVRNPGNI